jgi:hypothetical protein
VNPNASGFNDPQLSPERPGRNHSEELFEPPNDRALSETTGYLQNDDAVGRLGRKAQNVPEVVVEGDQRALFGNTGFEDNSVARAPSASSRTVATSCPDDRKRLSPRGPRFSSSLSFTGRLGRDGDDALACGLRAVGNGRQDVRVRELGIGVEKLRLRVAVCEEVQEEQDPDPCALDARLAEADVGIDADALKQWFHCRSPRRWTFLLMMPDHRGSQASAG